MDDADIPLEPVAITKETEISPIVSAQQSRPTSPNLTESNDAVMSAAQTSARAIPVAAVAMEDEEPVRVNSELRFGRDIGKPPRPGLITLTAKATSAPVPRVLPRMSRAEIQTQDALRLNRTNPAAALTTLAEGESAAAVRTRVTALPQNASPIVPRMQAPSTVPEQSLEEAAFQSAAYYHPSGYGAYGTRRHAVDPLHNRRAMIPIFLTLGAILSVVGIYLLMGGTDNALADLFPGWTGFAVLAVALAAFAAAGLNMYSVHGAMPQKSETEDR